MSKDPGAIPMGEPLAFFLTWTTYGSWLPGDERGWTEKPGRAREPSASRQMDSQRRMSEEGLSLSPEQREIVTQTISEHCRIRKWFLHAVNCRTQHVHVVVTAPDRSPDEVLEQFKAWCTRRLKEHALATGAAQTKIREVWWTQRGSKRQLFDEASLNAVIQYVLEGQGDTPRIER